MASVKPFCWVPQFWVDFELVFEVITKCVEFYVVDLVLLFFVFCVVFLTVLVLRDRSFSFQFFFLATSVFFHMIVNHDYLFNYDVVTYLTYGGWQYS